MDRSQKEVLVAEFKDIFEHALSGVLVSYQGSTVESLTQLRKTLNQNGAKFKVLKNTLARLGSQGTAYESLSSQFKDTRALVYSTHDPIAHAKVIADAVKTNEKLSIVAGLLVTNNVGKLLDEAGVVALSQLPSKEELLTKLLYVFNAPITNFARTLNEVPASFVRTLQAIADSKS
ncbi:MAG: 50S ribosomal protein L10 [Candidatus Lambdaproteobacteria bacterium RIFOXYD12_FULL_49_8]|nr:MAG: 50S ribosomal protein L10 [Candidatus Lambdaproteobacteria bacterium RIFOXYD12_FULL_49_8]